MVLTVCAPSGVKGTVAAPPSKSLAHRAVLCAALAAGPSQLETCLSARTSPLRWPLPGSCVPR